MYLRHKALNNYRRLWPQAVIVLIASVLITWCYPQPQSNRYFYEKGRPWNYAKLIAGFDIPVHPSEEVIQAAKDSLDAKFVPVYIINQLVTDSIIARLPDPPSPGLDRRLARMIRDCYASGVVDLETMEKIRDGSLPNVRILDINVLSESSTAGFSSTRDVYMTLDSTITDNELHTYFRSADLSGILSPNIIFSPTESKRHYDQAYLTLTADRGVIQQGQTIIDKGQIISPQDYTNIKTYEEMMEKATLKDSASGVLLTIGQFIYILLIFIALFGYLSVYRPATLQNLKLFGYIIGTITIFFLATAGVSVFTPAAAYLVPLAVVPILVLVFFDGRTALFVSAVTTMICAAITTFPLEFIFLQFMATSVVVYILRDLTKRSEMFKCAIYIAITYLASYIALEFLLNGTWQSISVRMILFLLLNGLLTSMSFLLMFASEKFFGLVSSFTLVELADTNTPLLRQLSEECPGTYQHALAVSTLAVDAAKRIHADENLIRAGALYHDIGKLANPAFFTENQHGVNPHDALPPERSAQIVVNHVSDGIAMAKKYGLPQEIKDFILQHHGKGITKYFYYQYCSAHPDEAVDKHPFSYPGPNPQTREASILMMADSVEAASRSLKTHTPDEIRGLVEKIVNGQIQDGLHNDSALELRDIKRIKEAFVKRLLTIYHSRIVYPDAPDNAHSSK